MLSAKNKTFEFVSRQAAIILDIVAAMNQDTSSQENYSKVSDLENQGDQVMHELESYQSTTFILPFDKEDSLDLGEAMDNVIDLLERAANRQYIYEISTTDEIKAVLASIQSGCNVLIPFLDRAAQSLKIEDIQEVKRGLSLIEVEADTLNRKHLKELFKSDDLKFVMQMREIYSYLERAVDGLEQVAYLLDRIKLKYL